MLYSTTSKYLLESVSDIKIRIKMTNKIFITGSAGCIGHYIIEELCDSTQNNHLYLLIRSPKKLHKKFHNQANITILEGSLEDIATHKSLLQDMNYLIHIATNWNGAGGTQLINIDKTTELFELCDSENLKRIIYFSTASILGPENKGIKEAELYGSSYVRTKYQMHQKLPELPNNDKIVTVFPTMVFGGNENYPKSHISEGIKSSLKYMAILKYIYIDGAFHFLHGKDIAKVCTHLLFKANIKKEYVLGNKEVTAKQALKTICDTFKIKQPFQLKIPMGFIFFLSKLLRIKIGPWELHCLNNPYMVFDTVNPVTFNLKSSFPTLESILAEST